MSASRSGIKQKTKIVIRRLPYDLTYQQIYTILTPYIQHIDYIWFEAGQARLPREQSRQSLVYVNVTDARVISQLTDVILRDHAKSLPGAQLELAPNQRIYRRGKKERRDRMEGTIEDDDDYKAFVNTLKLKQDNDKSVETESKEVVKDVVKEEKTVTGKLIQRTPIIDFLVEQMKRDKVRKVDKPVAEEKSTSSQSKRARNALRAVTRDDERKSDTQQRKKSTEKRHTVIQQITPLPKPEIRPIVEAVLAPPPSSSSSSTSRSSSSSQRGRARPAKQARTNRTEAWVVKVPASTSNKPAMTSQPIVSIPLPIAAIEPLSSRQSQPESSRSSSSQRGRARNSRGGARVSAKTESSSAQSSSSTSTNQARPSSNSTTSNRGRQRRGGAVSSSVDKPMNKSTESTSAVG